MATVDPVVAGTVRADTVQLLGELLPEDVHVISYSRAAVESLQGTTVMVRLDRIEPETDVPQATRRYTFGLIVITPLTEAPAADDELDAAVEDVIDALDQHPRFTWQGAERAVFEGTQTPCYQVTARQFFGPTPEPTE